MITKLKNVTFVFENCDYITIDGKYIGDFLIDDINTSIKRITSNAIEKMDYANIIVIEIHKDANKERHQFNQTNIEYFKQMTFDRFIGCDITSVEVVLEEDDVEDGQVSKTEKYNYYVNWTGESDNYNESHINYISEDGNLYVVIAEGKSVEDFFDLEEINDSDYMDFCFDMMDVGDEYSDPNRYNKEEEYY